MARSTPTRPGKRSGALHPTEQSDVYSPTAMSGNGFFDVREQLIGKRTARPAAAPAPTPPGAAMTVSQVTHAVDRAIRGGVPASLVVRGELSNFNLNRASGHAYFTLKDPTACLSCVMWRDDVNRLKFQPVEGMELLATGAIKVFAAQGKYQLYANRLEPLGKGALELAFQQLKAKLEAEGLFDPDRKRPLPRYPRRIAIVTSQDGAALQDMLKVIRRFPWIEGFVSHVPTQGDGCAVKIANAIERLNARVSGGEIIDLILLGRGGGSLEDLWGFNEEAVARAIAASQIPIVTGIGHEVDTTIADLVADYHAHTPTEAAQVITQQWRTAGDVLDAASLRLRRATRAVAQDARHRLTAIERHEVFRKPTDRINSLRQLLDDRQRALSFAIAKRTSDLRRQLDNKAERLARHGPMATLTRYRDRLSSATQRLALGVRAVIARRRDRVSRLSAELAGRHPRHQVRLENARLESLSARLERVAAAQAAGRRAKLEALATVLSAVSPERVLRRGYSITTRKKDGVVLRDAVDARPGDRLVTRLATGEVESVVDDSKQPRLFE